MKYDKTFWLSNQGMTIIAIVSLVSIYILNEHGAHFLQILPFLILAACPLMHLFMHHGHNHSNEMSKQENGKPDQSKRHDK